MLYFWQGHEEYCYQYNCHFYAGQQLAFPVPYVMPWFNSAVRDHMLNSPYALVKVVQVKTMFPSHRSISLINSYGKDQTDLVQTP